MTRRATLLAIASAVLLVGGARIVGLNAADSPFTKPANAAPAATQPVRLYHDDPAHPWNRLHHALMVRVGPDGNEYGHDRLEPILWNKSEYLLKGPAADRLLAALERFVDDPNEPTIADPVKRAILQRDCWHIANWAAEQDREGEKLVGLLARAMRKLALPATRIAELPDTYAEAIRAKRFPPAFDPAKPTTLHLPPDLFDPAGPWICIGRTDGPTAPQHVTDAGFAGTAFTTFVKLPASRDAGLAFVRELAAQREPMLSRIRDERTGRTGDWTFNPKTPQLPRGSELALVARAMLVDDAGKVVVSPIVERVQLRVIGIEPAAAPTELVFPMRQDDFDTKKMAVFELQLRRAALFKDVSTALVDTSDTPDFKTGFNTHGIDGWDQIANDPERLATFPKAEQNFFGRFSCFACHRSPTVYGTMSFQRFSPTDEELEEKSPVLFPIKVMSPAEVEREAVKWVEGQKGWKQVRTHLAP